MAKGDVTLSRRDHRALLTALETIEKHHTRRRDEKTGVIIEPSFPHDDEVHEDEVIDCPQCEVILSVSRLRELLKSGVARD